MVDGLMRGGAHSRPAGEAGDPDVGVSVSAVLLTRIWSTWLPTTRHKRNIRNIRNRSASFCPFLRVATCFGVAHVAAVADSRRGEQYEWGTYQSGIRSDPEGSSVYRFAFIRNAAEDAVRHYWNAVGGGPKSDDSRSLAGAPPPYAAAPNWQGGYLIQVV